MRWSDLFAASAGAAAALTGVVFVAVSINIKAILVNPGLPERALTSVLVLLGVAVSSILCLAPGQSRQVLGGELLVESLALLAVVCETLRAASVNPARATPSISLVTR